MAKELKFVVHGKSKQPVTMPVKMGDEVLMSTVDGLEIEFVALDGRSSSFTWRLIGQAAKEADELYKPDQEVTFVLEA